MRYFLGSIVFRCSVTLTVWHKSLKSDNFVLLMKPIVSMRPVSDHLKIDYRALRHQWSRGSVASSSGSNQRLDPKLR